MLPIGTLSDPHAVYKPPAEVDKSGCDGVVGQIGCGGPKAGVKEPSMTHSTGLRPRWFLLSAMGWAWCVFLGFGLPSFGTDGPTAAKFATPTISLLDAEQFSVWSAAG